MKTLGTRLGLVLALTISGCSTSSKPEVALFAETASFDITAGKMDRLMVGVSDKDGNSLTGGSVTFRLRSAEADGDAWGQPIDASYLPVPGRPASDAATPSLTAPSVAVGVYSTGPTEIPTAGIWEIQVDAGDLGKAQAAFTASNEPQALAVGAPAPASVHPVLSTPGVKPSQLDSLALDATELSAITDPELHRVTIADALAKQQPIVVVVATPAYCTSQFCGPLVDVLRDLQPSFPDVAFVHLEVFPEGYEKAVGTAAAQWIAQGGVPEGQGNEPWVFLVDKTGKVKKRWDNVLDVAELKEALGSL